jgi:NAD+ synthase/NAD+ synthase (glutamine-hydrolysing)
MRLALLQINPTAGDLEGNASPIVRAARARRKCSGADLVV